MRGRAARRIASSSDDSSFRNDEVSSTDSEDDASDTELFCKPTNSRVTLETGPLIDFMERNTRCKECQGLVKVQEQTTCVASTLNLRCIDGVNCGYIDYMDKPAAANVGSEDNRERNTDYAINLLYVLSMISCGDGGKEAQNILGFLGLPNSTTMERRSFTIIEDGAGPFIRQLTKDVLLENLIEEVRLTASASDDYDNNDFMLWKQSVTERNITLDKRKYPRIKVCFDMGWQQRGSGKSYNSQSGHALYIGGRTKKPVSLCIKSKFCNTCAQLRGQHGPVKDHDCMRNWFGSSGAMEAASALDMLVELYRQFNTVLEFIVADDDSSTRAMLSWDNDDYLKNNNTTVLPKVKKKAGPNRGDLQDRPDGVGRLPGDIPEPKFAADPNHRRKLLTGELKALAELKVAERLTMTGMDVQRINKNYGHFLKQMRKLNDEERESAGKAVLEHHFDNHEFCRAWCVRKRKTPEERLQSKAHYRCKTKDANLYVKLQRILERCISSDCLDDLSHGMNTNTNESFNNTFSWYAPKNKAHCGSYSLHNRIGMGIGVNSLGVEAHFRRLLIKLGTQMSPDMAHFLKVKDRMRSERLARLRSDAYRRKKMEHKTEQLKKDTAIAHKERAKRDGTCRRGMNFELGPVGGWTEQEITQPKKRSAAKHRGCATCQQSGHATPRSKLCGKHGEWLQQQATRKQKRSQAPTATFQSEEDTAREVNELDHLPLDDDSDMDLAAFHDAGTWSDDDDDDSVQPLGFL